MARHVRSQQTHRIYPSLDAGSACGDGLYSFSYDWQATANITPPIGEIDDYLFAGPVLRRMTAEQTWDSILTLVEGSKIDHFEVDQSADVTKFSSGFLEKFPDANVNSYREFYDHTLRLLRSEDLAAFDLTKESTKMRDAYGKDKFGQGCLLARRLVETGIRYVEVTSEGWDMHTDIKGDMDDIAPSFDQTYAALITDLKQRGLLDSTLVVLATEFGRKPAYNGKGRGHYLTAFTCGLAGAGIKRGFVYGSTDEAGAQPDKPVTIGDFHATIGHAAGLPLDQEFKTSNGRPFYVGGKGAKPIMDMFA